MVGVIVMLIQPPTTTIPARRSPALRRTASTRLLVFVALLVCLLGVFASSAFGKITTLEGHTYGVTPRGLSLGEGDPAGFENAEGHAVVKSSNVYAIYWDPTRYFYHGDWQHVIDEFFSNVGSESGKLSNVFAVDTQYVDKENHRSGYKITFRGAYTDTDPYPTRSCTDPEPLAPPNAVTCVTDTQIQEELKSFIAQHTLQTGMNAVFYVLTPPGVTVCLDNGGPSGRCSDYQTSGELKVTEEHFKRSFCSYHSAINPTESIEGDASTVLYAVVPWIAGELGDPNFFTNEQASGYACQDGGWDPSSKTEGEKREEKKKEKNAAEEETFSKMDKEEREKQEKKEALEGPHQEEPNQKPCPTQDGGCDTGLADLIINQIAVEQQNITTDPLMDSWHDPTGGELMDECRNVFALVEGGSVTAQETTGAGSLFNQTFGTDSYYLNDTFNLAALELQYPGVACINRVALEPQFTAPNQINANEIVGFDGMESDVTLDAGFGFSPNGESHPTYATFTWDFGDGSAPVSGYAPGAPSVNSPGVSPCAAPWEAPCAASTYHSYQYGGTYKVTLTVTDIGGDTGSVTKPVTIIGPPAPSSTTPEGGGPSGSATPAATPASQSSPTSAGPGGSATGSPAPPTPAPVVSGFATSKSLKKALSGGLAVHYTTNEQVAGSIQVLLESSVAHRLGIHGSNATGLPKGAPASIVVGTAVLVTTKAGHGTIHIKFSSRTAARLAHTRKLKLTLRLFARNASRQSPQTTTVLSSIVLNR